jgi:hypothetical protein
MRPAATMMIGNETPKKKMDGDESSRSHSDHKAIAKRSFAHANDGLNNDREDGCLETKKQSLDKSDIAEHRVDETQRHDGDGAGKDEQTTGNDTTNSAIH